MHGDSPFDNPEIVAEMAKTRDKYDDPEFLRETDKMLSMPTLGLVYERGPMPKRMAVRCESRDECDIGYRCGYGTGLVVDTGEFGFFRVEDWSPIHHCTRIKKDVILRNRHRKAQEGGCDSIW
jgi:hypothetical protein